MDHHDLPTLPVLPALTSHPAHHPSYCLSLSTTLLTTLSSILTSPSSPSDVPLTLSIGSGTGLLEAFLVSSSKNIKIHAIEVSSDINTYLPSSHISTVPGTFALSPLAAVAEFWMFVYPRDPRLVRRYLDEYGKDGKGIVSEVIWLGPIYDWEEEYCNLFHGFVERDGGQVEVVPDCGLVEYEMLALWRKSAPLKVGGS